MFFSETFVPTGFFSATVGATLGWGFGTLGVCVTGVVSAVTGRDDLRPRLWDRAATGVIVAEEDSGFSEGRSLVGVVTGGC
jgi:hypothetical protein